MDASSLGAVIEQTSPRSSTAGRALWAYMDDVVSRYYGRPATSPEVQTTLHEFPSGDLEPPRGVLIVAAQDGDVLGCAGLRLLAGGVGEVSRLHVVATARRRGLGTQLMRELERLAREHRRTTLRLDTRDDLVEARRLYARLEYREVSAFNAGPYSEHWFEKKLT